MNHAESASFILVTGPARSGKSEWAEHLALWSKRAVTYIATSQVAPTDTEWQARIQQHRQRRPTTWAVREVPHDLSAAIAAGTSADCLLIDSLGTWLANQLDQPDTAWEKTCQDLVESLTQTPSQVILVAEETGWGVVPAYPIGRQFRDRLGHLTRRLGGIATSVYLVTGGFALDLRFLGQPVDGAWAVNPSPTADDSSPAE